MIRSMSDEQMLARYGYDKNPWETVYSGTPFPVLSRHAEFVAGTAYNPRPECIPSPDPKPWIDGYSGTEWFRLAKPRHSDEFKPRPWGSFTPDPEFVRPPVNPILSAFRDDLAFHKGEERVVLQTYLYGPMHAYTDEQVDDARKVLTRLARLTS